MSFSWRCRAIRSSISRRRLVKILMRASSSRNAFVNALALSSSDPAAAAGSSMPQCAVIGWPGQTGHTSAAALSQTVNTNCIGGASGDENSFQLLLRRCSVGSRLRSSVAIASGCTSPFGKLPALKRVKAALAPVVQERLRHDAARRVAGAEEQNVVEIHLFSLPARRTVGDARAQYSPRRI